MGGEDSSFLSSDLLRVGSSFVCFYVLKEHEDLYLVDTGFVGGAHQLDRALSEHGWSSLPIRGILLTHGHLDHVFNAARFARRDGAWIAGPKADRDRYLGQARACGAHHFVGAMETIARKVCRFEPFTPDRWVEDGDEFPIWQGLRAVHLPGHTAGHTGYWCEAKGILFCGDLFASYGPFSHRPPGCFNVDSSEARRSVGRALSFEPLGVHPHHCNRTSPEVHLERLKKL